MNESEKKNVLFISTKDYDLSKDDSSLEEKFKGLSKRMNVFVLARGKSWKHEMYGAEFYLTPKIGTVPWMFVSLIKGWWLVKRKKIDVIIAQSPLFDGFVATIINKIYKKKLIIEAHSDWVNSLFLQHRVPFKTMARRLFIRLGRFSLTRADTVRVVSEALRDLVLEHSPNSKIVKFPAFTDIDIFKNESDISWEPIILFTGSLYRLKGVQLLIESFGRLQSRFSEFKLVIIGNGPYQGDLEKLASSSKIKKIEFIGSLNQEQVKDWMKKCWCFVLPSLSEGLGLVLLEAASLGKPLIGSDTGGIPEIIMDGENGFLFTPGSIEELVKTMEKIMSDKNLAISMGETGKRIAEDKFSLEKYYDGYFSLVGSR
ncbi:glycosyltransferase family 4 protein [Candidatus Parcubacteria bacterium]|nr:glycosyltransferase family 4 protein [Candidatus Parcubacteria bacterium]